MNYTLSILCLLSTAALSGMAPPSKSLAELERATLERVAIELCEQMAAEIAEAEARGLERQSLSQSAPRPIPGQFERDYCSDSGGEDERRLAGYMDEWDEKVGSFEKLEADLRRSGKLGRRKKKSGDIFDN